MRRSSTLLVISALAMAFLASACLQRECYSSYYDAMSDVAPDDLDCKPDDVGYGYGLNGTWAEGCGRVARYACSSGSRRSTCRSCSLIGVEQY